MDEEYSIRNYKDRLRIFLIIYYFAEDYSDNTNSSYKKLFKSEVRIQKIDFLLRNPDYLAFELLNIAKSDNSKSYEIKVIVKDIFKTEEPTIRRLEMERFFFGAYEDIDDVIGFLKSIGFIDFSSKKNSELKTVEKRYFITEKAIKKMESISSFSSLEWYIERCLLVKRYFGDCTGTQLKIAQYQIAEYRDTSYNSYIGSIQGMVVDEYFKLYNEKL